MRYGHQNPNKPPIGRQPAIRRIVPSKPNPWYGTIKGATNTALAQQGGDRLTLEQQDRLACRGMLANTVEIITVRRQATGDEVWCPIGNLPEVFAFDCPVVGHHADGRPRVITPSGAEKLIRKDGWDTWPKTKGKWAW